MTTAPRTPWAPPPGPTDAALTPVQSVMPDVPAPPPGPGVHPPFPAPPVEGRGTRIGLGLGVGAGVVVLVCGGGVAALIGLGTSMAGALDEQAHVVVGKYLDALHDGKYDQAYGLLCDEAQDDETPAEFRTRVAAMDPIESYELGSLDMVSLTVPVDVRYSDGDTAQLDAHLGQDRNTGEFEVCDVGE